MNPVKTVHILSRSAERTQSLARSLLTGLAGGAVLALHGELGSGKTCFVQGLARGLGVDHPVTSPTFTIINEHHGRLPLYHVDLYRIRHPDEALSIGLEDYLFGDGITAIEWAERAGDLLPASTIHVYFERCAGARERRITIERPTA